MTCLIASYHLPRLLCPLLVWIPRVRYSLSTWLNAQQKSRWKINYLMAKKKKSKLNPNKSGPHCGLCSPAEPLDAVLKQEMAMAMTRWVFLCSPAVLTHSLKHFTFIRKAGILFSWTAFASSARHPFSLWPPFPAESTAAPRSTAPFPARKSPLKQLAAVTVSGQPMVFQKYIESQEILWRN